MPFPPSYNIQASQRQAVLEQQARQRVLDEIAREKSLQSQQPQQSQKKSWWSNPFSKSNQTGQGANKFKPTEKRRKVGKQTRVVYVGPRGGQYVKMQGRFVNVKEL